MVDDPSATPAQEGRFSFGAIARHLLQATAMFMVMNTMTTRPPKQLQGDAVDGGVQPDVADSVASAPSLQASGRLRNLYSAKEECELFVHFGMREEAPSLAAVLDKAAAADEGLELLWQQRVWYASNATSVDVNVTVGPLRAEVLNGSSFAHVHATLIRTSTLQSGEPVPPTEVIQQSLPVVARLRELDVFAGAENLFSGEHDRPRPVLQSAKLPFFKTKLDVRPVFDESVHTHATISQGPFRRIRAYPELGVYQPVLYLSDFWLLEKDYLPLNETLAGRQLNLSLSYSVVALWAWTMQVQMSDQWAAQSETEWNLSDPQRDSFMLKRLLIDTNPYLLAFSAAFISLHVVFNALAFKNDVQFWRKNESMQGLSARSICVRFVCTLVEVLYLLDSQEVSKLILFQIFLDLGFSSWMLGKAVRVELKPVFPFLSFSGRHGYEESGTSKYDKEALHYMSLIMAPLFVIYAGHSLIYGKHRGWYSYAVNTAAGAVYSFGFVLMTPQLYINYKLKSVEHLPWRALTYKAMNTFVDDIAALLIDMPLMRRLSCFRDDVIFFIYLFQRWKYRVDKSRPSMWVQEDPGAVAAPVENPHSEVQECEVASDVGAVAADVAAVAEDATASEPAEEPMPQEGEPASETLRARNVR